MTAPSSTRPPAAEPATGARAWIAEAAAVFAKEWRTELRTRYALNTLGLFALTTLVTVSFGLGPLGTSSREAESVLPVVLWIVLLFAVAAGLPRVFVHEEESGTATLLRLAATPSAVFTGKALYAASVTAALELLVTPLFVALTRFPVESPLLFAAVLAVGGVGLAIGSTLIAALISQAEGRSTLFAVVAFPVLLPLFLLLVEATRDAVVGDPGTALLPLVLYDAAVATAGLMLFPSVWNP